MLCPPAPTPVELLQHRVEGTQLAVSGSELLRDLVDQLGDGHGCGPKPFDFDPGCEIRQMGRGEIIASAGQAHSERRQDDVAGAGYIVDVAGSARDHLAEVPREEIGALFVQGDEYGVKR